MNPTKVCHHMNEKNTTDTYKNMNTPGLVVILFNMKTSTITEVT